MANQQTKILIEIDGKADGHVAATNESIKALERQIATVKQLGGATQGLEQELEKLREVAAQQKFGALTGGLEDAIKAEKALGNETAQLEQRLTALRAATGAI